MPTTREILPHKQHLINLFSLNTLQVQGTSLKQIIDIFKQLNESIALVYIDEMIARQLEDDY